MPDIIIVEDNREIGTLLCDFLRKENYTVSLADTGEKALQIFEQYGANLVVIDIGLPGVDGYSVCSKIRETSNAHIMIATARDDKESTLKGLQIGADDYITKPFSVSELMARVEALARRVRRSATADDEQAGSEPDQLVSGPFVLDEKSRVLYKSGKPIDLTQVEFQIMECFLKNPNVALERNTVLSKVWGENYFGDVKIVDVNIRRLRMKIEDEPSNPKYLTTVWGYGYKWSVSE